MNFLDILNLFKQGKGTTQSHIKNLIEIAASDGDFDQLEYDLLKRIAKHHNISSARLKAIQNNPNKVAFEIPADEQEKFNQMYDLVHMMIVDKEIHPEEMKLCNLFASKFGYPKDNIDEIIITLQGNIKNGNGPIDTKQRIDWLLA